MIRNTTFKNPSLDNATVDYMSQIITSKSVSSIAYHSLEPQVTKIHLSPPRKKQALGNSKKNDKNDLFHFEYESPSLGKKQVKGKP